MLYNKYRPQEFKEVIGQEHVVATVMNALEKNMLGQSIMLSGTHGTGKTTIARLIAKQIGAITEDIHEIDAASNNSVEDARKLIKSSRFAPSQQKRGSKKVYIIDEAHMYSNQAFNAMLKIIEEPPKHCVFIFCTTEPEKILATIKSRCMSLFLRKIDTRVIADYLVDVCKKEDIEYEEEALLMIAKKANGSMRDALSDLELCRSRCKVTDIEERLGMIPSKAFLKILVAIKEGKVTDIMLTLNEILKWHEADKIVKGFVMFLHELLYAKGPETIVFLNNTKDVNIFLAKMFKSLGGMFCLQLLNEINRVIQYPEMSQKAIRISFELALIKAAQAMKRKNTNQAKK